jgi:hypothetical protein
MATRPNLFLHRADQFSDHPSSIAGRIRRRALARSLKNLAADSGPEDEGLSWLDLTLDSTDEEIETAYANTFGDTRPRRTVTDIRTPTRLHHPCPLGTEWVDWDMFGPPEHDFRLVTDSDRIRCEHARKAEPTRHAGRLKLRWGTARSHDEDTTRMHVEADVAGRVLHIDHITRRRYGPGRSFQEFRLFVDELLEGRGGSAGCSLGFGGGDLPAVALIGDRLAVTVDTVPDIRVPVVELWEVELPQII